MAGSAARSRTRHVPVGSPSISTVCGGCARRCCTRKRSGIACDSSAAWRAQARRWLRVGLYSPIGTRTGTQASMRLKDDYVMDVDEDTVAARMAEHHAALLIHGHTHRPGVHDYAGPTPRRRIVLGDWYEQDSVLVCEPGRQRLVTLDEFLAAG